LTLGSHVIGKKRIRPDVLVEDKPELDPTPFTKKRVEKKEDKENKKLVLEPIDE